MNKSKYTQEQIAFALRQAELGTPVADVCRKLECHSKHSTDGKASTEECFQAT